MSKLIPPPPPKPKTKRVRTRTAYLSPEVQRRVLRTSGTGTRDDLAEHRRTHKEVVERRLLPGSPQYITSNMPAVSSAIGATDERGAERKREREYRVSWDGRTSNLPELGGTPRKNDVKRARKDQ